MQVYTDDELQTELTQGIFVMVVDAPSGEFSSAIGTIEDLTGTVGVTITKHIRTATHYLYLAESDYMDDAASFLRRGGNRYADSVTKLDKPLVIFYDSGDDSGLRLYSPFSDNNERVILAELGNADWEDLGL